MFDTVNTKVLDGLMNTRDLLTSAVKRAGSEEKLGKALGYTQHAIWRARRVGRVSPEMASKIHDWSGGFISKHDLRPDLFGPASSKEGAAA
jgi:DNA-binding transcriptional regulator YdaS (Cro superfamily)